MNRIYEVSMLKSVDQVLITDELARRSSRTPDLAAENEALIQLMREMAESPDTAFQKLVDTALELCRADSAAVSILEPGENAGVFRWHAIAGDLAVNLYGSLPRDASPCGTVLDRNCTLLFNEPARFFSASREVEPHIYEALLVPFQVGGKPVGIVWAVAHRPERRFDAEDQRLLQNLSRFAAAAYTLHERTRAQEGLDASRMAALNLMEDAVAAREQAERTSAALRESEGRLAADLAGMMRLYDLNERLANAPSLKAALQSILGVAIAFMGMDRGNIQLLGADGKTLEITVQHGHGQAFIDYFMFRGCEAICGAALDTRKRVIVDDVTKAPLLQGTKDIEVILGDGIRAIQSTPLVTRQGRNVGILNTHSAETHRPSEDAFRRLDLLTWMAADFIERARAEEALRKSEALLQKAFSIETVGVLFFSLDGRMTEANEAFVRMSGYSRKELLNAVHLENLTAPEFREATARAASELAARGDTAPYEKQFIRKDGSRWWGLVAPTRLSGAGSESECVKFVIDITTRKLAEDELRKATEELAAANIRLEQKVVARTRQLEERSIQLRSLAVQATQAEAQERKRIAQVLHDHLQQVIIAAKYKLHAHASRRKNYKPVFELLDEGVRSARSLAAEISPPALYHPDFAATLDWLATFATEQYGLKVTISSDAGEVVLSDEQKVVLYQAARELLLNIFKHTKAKQARLRWGACSRYSILRVEDKGAGFDPAQVAEKADAGFGLFAIRERLEALGGGLVIRSRPKRGTRIAMVLPRLRKRTTKAKTVAEQKMPADRQKSS